MRDVAVSVDGLPIHYEVKGQGLPALVFIHGWSCDQSYWQNQMDYFAPHYTVVFIDLGGHGDSGLNRDIWTMGAFGQDVVAVVEKLDLHQVILIGHSMGGTVSVEAAQRLPARVIGLIGVETFKTLGRTRTKAEIDTLLAPFYTDFVPATSDFVRTRMFLPTSDIALVETIANDMAAAPPRVARSAIEQLFSRDAEVQAGLQALPVPVTVINSDFVPTDKETAERCGITVESMSGVGHFVMLEDAEAFNPILENAVQRIHAESTVE